jgi:hypothetical protein
MRRRTYLKSLATVVPVTSVRTNAKRPSVEQVRETISDYQFTHENEDYLEYFFETLTLRVFFWKENRDLEFCFGRERTHMSTVPEIHQAVQQAKEWEYEARKENEELYVEELNHATSGNRIQYRKYTDDREQRIHYNSDEITHKDVLPIVIST